MTRKSKVVSLIVLFVWLFRRTLVRLVGTFVYGAVLIWGFVQMPLDWQTQALWHVRDPSAAFAADYQMAWNAAASWFGEKAPAPVTTAESVPLAKPARDERSLEQLRFDLENAAKQLDAMTMPRAGGGR